MNDEQVRKLKGAIEDVAGALKWIGFCVWFAACNYVCVSHGVR